MGLGSNLGDRLAHLHAALTGLGRHGITVEEASSVYETEPVTEVEEMREQPEFLNACLRIGTSLDPEAVLDACKTLEVEEGRMFGGPRHGPRSLDIDVLLLGEHQIESGKLTIPHPEITRRRFVLEPLLELDPILKLPDGTSLADCLAALPRDEQRVRRVGLLA